MPLGMKQPLSLGTLPNPQEKQRWIYSGSNPTYFEPEAIALLVNAGIKHLLTDLPSVDREEDGANCWHTKHSGIIHKKSIVKIRSLRWYLCPITSKTAIIWCRFKFLPLRSMLLPPGYFCMKIWIDAAVGWHITRMRFISGFIPWDTETDCRILKIL